MADAAAWRHYIGDRRLVECKPKAQEGSAAHHEHVGARSETGEATATRVNVHGDHGEAKLVGGGVPVTAVGKTTKQEWIKHYSIEMKL